ncbi:MAG TPA: hypothetical protein PL110_01820 [Candidatus Eremiobacteraeota bacterium]|nr:hypothetical protein [Candidatus Eremiobacteraeota bacterium]
MKVKKLFFICFFFLSFLSITTIAFSENILELIGEVKFVQNGNSGYYALIVGGKHYALINLPRQKGELKEGKYKIMGITTLDIKDPLFTGPIPLQVTQMNFMASTSQPENNQNGSVELTGVIFFNTKIQNPVYMLSVAGPNNSHTYYTLINIPPQPGKIPEGTYKVTGIINSTLQGISGTTSLQITKLDQINPQQKEANAEQEFTGMILFMPLGNIGGIGYYMLQTQDNQQYALINLPQEEGKLEPGQYKLKGTIIQNAPNPYNIALPFINVNINTLNLIVAMPGMNNSMDIFNFNEDEDEDGSDSSVW